MLKQTRKTGKEANAKGKMWIPVEDRAKVRKEGIGLQDYWLDCWQTDPFGNRWTLMCSGEEAASEIKSTTKAKYRKQLKAMRMFLFEERKDGKDKSLWVRNLRGSRAISIEQILDEEEQSLDANEETLDQIEQLNAETLGGKGAESSSISLQKLLKSPSTTVTEVEEESAAVSFSDSVEEKTSVKKPVGVSEQLLVNPEDCVAPDPLCSVKPYQESCREKVTLSASMKSSAPAHVELSRNDTLISEFDTWLSQTGRESYRKDLVGLAAVMQKADEKVLGDAIAHVKEKIDSIKSSFGGYLRTAIEKQLKPLQKPPVIVQEVQKRPEAPTLLNKDGFVRMSGMELYERFSTGGLVRSNREISMNSITEAERLLGKKYPRDLMLDMLGNTGSIHPIANYYKSRGLDFSTVEPHLITEYLICESDGLPVVCFCDKKTGQYELVVVTR